MKKIAKSEYGRFLNEIKSCIVSARIQAVRMFYLEYKDNSKLAQLVPELPWGHNILVMQKVKSRKEREYYITALGTGAGETTR